MGEVDLLYARIGSNGRVMKRVLVGAFQRSFGLLRTEIRDASALRITGLENAVIIAGKYDDWRLEHELGLIPLAREGSFMKDP